MANWLMVATNDLPDGGEAVAHLSTGLPATSRTVANGAGASIGGGLPVPDYSSTVQLASTAPLMVSAAPATTQSSVSPMKPLKAFLIAGAMLAGVLAFGQTDSIIHVKTFPGVTVGEKVSAAMLTCQARLCRAFSLSTPRSRQLLRASCPRYAETATCTTFAPAFQAPPSTAKT